MKKIKLTKAEKQSGYSRIDWAESLIIQLPDHKVREVLE